METTMTTMDQQISTTSESQTIQSIKAANNVVANNPTGEQLPLPTPKSNGSPTNNKSKSSTNNHASNNNNDNLNVNHKQTTAIEKSPTQMVVRELLEQIIDKVDNCQQPEQPPSSMTANRIESALNQVTSTEAPPSDNDTDQNDTTILIEPEETSTTELHHHTGTHELITSRQNVEAIDTEDNVDMVTLKNLEISPPPPHPPTTSASTLEPTSIDDAADDNIEKPIKTEEGTGEQQKQPNTNKRRRPDPVITPDIGSSTPIEGGRSKRQRTQTQRFQAGDSSNAGDLSIETSSSTESASPVKHNRARSSIKGRKKPTASSSQQKQQPNNAQSTTAVQENFTEERQSLRQSLQDVIFYEKNDYLAIRNEENSFYLCQLSENVRVFKPMIRVRWLDTQDDGKTYFLTSHYDKVPHKSVIMPVGLEKLTCEKKGDQQLFELHDQDKDVIMDRLKRSLNATVDLSSSQESNVVE